MWRCRFAVEGEKVSLRSALICAGGNALDIEFLHDDKQNRDGDGHQHTACTEQRKVVVDERSLQHIEQADGDCPVGGDAGVQNHLRHNEVRPGNHKGADDGVHQNRLGHRQHDLKEYPRIGGTVQLGGLTQGNRRGIKKALTDQVAKSRRTGIDHDKTGVGVGQVEVLQNEVNCNHRQNAGEQIDDDRQILEQPAPLKAAAAQCVGDHQHKAGGDNAGKARNHKGVYKPPRELRNGIGVEHDVGVVVQCITNREKAPHIDAAVSGEGGCHQPDNGHQPDTCQQGKNQMADNAAHTADDVPLAQLRLRAAGQRNCLLCQENVASFLLMKRKQTSVKMAQMINTIMPMTAAIL